jgi:pimeloyl-ACP methyl ester carboxylesterase
LDYEDVSFEAADGVTLRGWLIPGRSDKVYIQSHFALFCNRAGYTNEGKGMFLKGYPHDVHFLRQAKYLHDAGYTVLMYDFRNHGESDTFRDGYVSQGKDESQDVVAAVDYISKHPDYRNADIGLLSICMGFGASIYAFGRDDGLRRYPQIRCMYGIQPMDYGTWLRAMGLPQWLRADVLAHLEKASGLDFEKASWRPFVQNVSVPTKVVQNTNDGFLDKEFVDGVFADLAVDKEMKWIELPDMKNRGMNRMAAYDWVGTASDDVLAWFARHL